MRSVTLASASTADGNKATKPWGGGVGTIHASGTFDGATLTLQYKPAQSTSDISTAFANTDVVLSGSVLVKNFFLGSGEIRVVQATSGGSSSLTCHAVVARV